MGRPRQTSDDEILSAARECFLSRGPAASAQDIARRAGVSTATLFQRFGTKERLMVAALGPPKRLPWAERLEHGPDERPMRQQLVELAAAVGDYFGQIGPSLAMLRAANIPPERVFPRSEVPPPVQAQRAVAAWLDRAQARAAIRACNTAVLATALVGALQVRSFLESSLPHQHRPPDRAEYVEALVGVLWNGLRPAGRRP